MKHTFVIGLFTVAALVLSSAALSQPDAPQYKAGVNYKVLKDPQPTSAPEGKIEVIEFFWYACPHCFAFQPYLEKWLHKDKPANVKFVRVPVANGFRWAEIYARAFYTEKALGLVDKLHDAFFREIHIEHHFLNTKDAIKAFFVAHGVSAKQFETTWSSFAVSMNVKKASNMQTDYHIMGVPMMAVDGRYKATLQNGQGLKALPKVVDFLVDKSTR